MCRIVSLSIGQMAMVLGYEEYDRFSETVMNYEGIQISKLSTFVQKLLPVF